MNKYSHKKGFTLPELLVSMSVMVMVIVSATNLVVSAIRSNTSNINTLIAYGLAQEGLEGVRNIRDSNWLLGAGFNGMISVGTDDFFVWGKAINDSEDEVFYTIDLDAFQKNSNPVEKVYSLAHFVPWRLKVLEFGDLESDKTLIKKYINENTGEFRYGHSSSSVLLPSSEKTPFHRYISIKKVKTDFDNKPEDFNKMRVSSVVAWMEGNRERELRLDTELTDWNKGQL